MMNRNLFFILVLMLFLAACEDIYTPDIEKREGIIVADARIVNGAEENSIKIYKSIGFNERETGYPVVSGSRVELIDNEGNNYPLPEIRDGEFQLNFTLQENRMYKLKITYQDDVYESEFETVPGVPRIDTLYGISGSKIIQQGGETNVHNFYSKQGVQLYADITNHADSKYYRFTARKTYQYVYYIPDLVLGEVSVYAWKTTYPQEPFNIAAPAEYSSSVDIKKHPLYFMVQKTGIVSGELFAGWILFLYQYSISENAYNFYKDLNSQLIADGKLFDPLYVQARNNLSCITDPEKIILGNFEISTRKEIRYFVWFISEDEGYLIKKIPHYYNIPLEGETVEIPPDFWETPSKVYPNEE